MPEYLRCQVTLNNDSGVPADKVVNTLHFKSSGTGTQLSDITEVNPHVIGFYQDIDNFIFSENLSLVAQITWFDLSEPEPRVPIYGPADFALAPHTGSFPNELAICLSFQGSRLSGTPQARRRGRIFLGPLSNIVAQDVNGDVTVTSSARSTIAVAANTRLMGDLSTTATDVRWSVFSPTTLAAPGGSLFSAFTQVTNGWVDDAFDIQRSRGRVATLRTIFP